MKKILTKSFYFILLASLSVIGQERNCDVNDRMQLLFDADPSFEIYHNDLMDQLNSPSTTTLTTNQVVTIPVVFHVLYKNSQQNISDAQILSQLAVLNADYRKLNADFNSVVPAQFQPFGADIEINFCLATQTPDAQPTNGITRKSDPSSFTFEDDYYTASGQPAWNNQKYLNIWVGRFTNNGLLGFAYLPSASGQPFDGLCIGDQFMGTNGTAQAPYNKGRTATHEIGHYFGLNHPWGNNSSCSNSDNINDTPNTTGPYYGCPTFPSAANLCSSAVSTSPNGAMFMNYMDYVNDACMALFTNDQKTVMRNALSGPRAALLTSNACANLGIEGQAALDAISIYPTVVSEYFKIASPHIEVDKVEIFASTGQLVHSQEITDSTTQISIAHLQVGVYYLRLYNNNEFLKSDRLIKK